MDVRDVGTVYRGKPSFLQHVIKIIIHTDAYYMSFSPHCKFASITQLSIDVARPARNAGENIDDRDDTIVDEANAVNEINDVRKPEERKYDDEDEDEDYEGNAVNDSGETVDDDVERGEWEEVDSGNVFNSLELDDVATAW